MSYSSVRATVMLVGVPFFVSSAGAQSFRIARGYLSAKDLAEPAQFAVVRQDSTWLTKLDAALVISKGLSGVTLTGGYYASIGTLRAPQARVHGPWGGLATDVWKLTADGTAAWESTAKGDVRASTVTARVTPSAWPALGIGVPKFLAELVEGRLRKPRSRVNAGSFVELSWRPTIGMQFGTLQTAPGPIEVAPDERFSRLLASTSVRLRLLEITPIPPTPEEPEPGSKRESRFELSASLNAWHLQQSQVTRTQFIAGIALPVNASTKVRLDWETARKPPAFQRERILSLGIGFSKN